MLVYEAKTTFLHPYFSAFLIVFLMRKYALSLKKFHFNDESRTYIFR